VLSNEAWYHGGAELDQLVAQTVIRSLETSTPIVRCTVDGWSLAIDDEGRVVAELPRLREPREGARVLRVFMPLGPGRLGPMAWLPSAVVWAMLALVGLGLLHAATAWARLPSVRPSRNSGPGAVPGPVADSGGS
jgi:apolipoprotein N-acyltransferase